MQALKSSSVLSSTSLSLSGWSGSECVSKWNSTDSGTKTLTLCDCCRAVIHRCDRKWSALTSCDQAELIPAAIFSHLIHGTMLHFNHFISVDSGCCAVCWQWFVRLMRHGLIPQTGTVTGQVRAEDLRRRRRRRTLTRGGGQRVPGETNQAAEEWSCSDTTTSHILFVSFMWTFRGVFELRDFAHKLLPNQNSLLCFKRSY